MSRIGMGWVRVDFRVLGELDVRDRTGQPLSFVRRKQRLLLAGLLLEANRPVPADRITGWLWDEQPPDSAEQNLYSYVSGLRRQLDAGSREDSRIRARSRHYLLHVAPGELDAEVFEQLVAEGRRAADAGEYATAVERLTRALGLWRGTVVLDGLELPEGLRDEAIRLEKLRVVALEAAFEARLALGQHRELLPELETAVHQHPLHERLWAQLMLALYRAGRQAEALARYGQAAKTLDAELGVQPGAELRRLRQRIVESDPGLTGPAGPSGPVAGPARQPVPAQLPAVPSSFTGRTDELADLLGMTGERRTVVISAIDGMAGVGKTTLAVEFAHRVADQFPDGHLFVDLHGFTEGVAPVEPADALERMLRALGVPSSQIPDGLDDRSALWRTRMADWRGLIVLDNAMTEAQVLPLLPGGSGCLVLITSRRRLVGLDDAWPLSLDVLSSPDAVALFIRTAGIERIADEPPERVAEVVELCGRLPLAIRIAAARFRHRTAWNLAHLIERLRHQQDRLAELEAGQLSVAAAVRLSYEQLGDEQRRMFRLAGLHPGPDLEPAAAAALAETTRQRAERLLDDLLDAHLLQQHEPGRYRFHDLIRAYAVQTCAEHEPESQRNKALTRLLDYHAHTAAAAVEELFSESAERTSCLVPVAAPERFDGAADTLAWLDSELANLLAGAIHAAEQGWAPYVLHMSGTLHLYIQASGRFHDGEKLHTWAHRIAHQIDDRHSERLALTNLALIYLWHGRYRTAGEFYERALAIAYQTEERVGQINPLIGLGAVWWRLGQLALGADYFERALAVSRELRHRGGQRAALVGVARVCRDRGQYERAAECLDQALALSRQIGDRCGDRDALSCYGDVLWAQGKYEAAVECFLTVLGRSREVFDRSLELEALIGLANTHQAIGDSVQALAYHRQALALAERIGLRVDQTPAHAGVGRVRGEHTALHELRIDVDLWLGREISTPR